MILQRRFLSNPGAQFQLNCLARESLGTCLSLSPTLLYFRFWSQPHVTAPSFYMSAEDMNWGPHACTEGVLTTRSSLTPFVCFKNEYFVAEIAVLSDEENGLHCILMTPYVLARTKREQNGISSRGFWYISKNVYLMMSLEGLPKHFPFSLVFEEYTCELYPKMSHIQIFCCVLCSF